MIGKAMCFIIHVDRVIFANSVDEIMRGPRWTYNVVNILGKVIILCEDE